MKVGAGSLLDAMLRARGRWSVGRARRAGLRLGRDVTFFGRVNWGSEPWLIEIGDATGLSGRVAFITHDGGTAVWQEVAGPEHVNRFGPIRVGRNCFIGYGVTILPDVEIGDNCVIGAGSVVTRDVPSDSVAAGSPARVVCTLEQYGKRAEAETLLQLGHSPDELWAAVWRRFDESRAR